MALQYPNLLWSTARTDQRILSARQRNGEGTTIAEHTVAQD